jgi:hypothetical protein
MLSHDIARCGNGDKCPSRDTCMRWIDKGHPTYQAYSAFYTDGNGCYAYISEEHYKEGYKK